MDRSKKSQDVGDARMAMGNKLVQQSQAEFLLNKTNKNIFKEALEINTSNTRAQEKHTLGRKEPLWQCLSNTQTPAALFVNSKEWPCRMRGAGGEKEGLCYREPKSLLLWQRSPSHGQSYFQNNFCLPSWESAEWWARDSNPFAVILHIVKLKDF